MFHSVRARLTLWYTGILAVVLITFSVISYAILARDMRAATDASIAATSREFSASFARRGETVLPDFRFTDNTIMLFDRDGRLTASSQPQFTGEEQQLMGALARSGFMGFATVAGGQAKDGIRVRVDRVDGRHIVVATNLHDDAQQLADTVRAMAFGIPLALLLAAGGGYLMARKSLAPVTTMSSKARQIGAETLTERIGVENERDELGFLATTLNELLERLQRAFDSQRSFMADASHELRTPLAIIQGESDVSLSRDRTTEEYRESISIIQTAARKLTRIVESLFLLARSDAGRYPITTSRFYLDELLSDCVRALRSVAATHRVELRFDAPSEMMIVADEALIHRMVLNLVDNALKFTPPGGRVTVSADMTDDEYTIRVEDTGIGIAEGDRDRIFERFYRGDWKRSKRGIGHISTGAGLGLPIARWIAEIHHGTLVLEHSDDTGTAFVTTLPRAREVDAIRSATLQSVRAVTPSTPDTSRSQSR